MKNAHTPGPWRVNKKVNTSVEQATAPQGMVLICQCEDPDGARTNKEDEANARLIAAAPELLAAVEEAKAQIEFIWQNYFPIAYKNGNVDKSSLMVINQCNEAIQKAKGE